MSTLATTPWQASFLQVLPTVVTHAQIQFRKLPADQREESIQEAIASACVSWQLLAAQGKLHVARPGMIADYAVKHVRNGRHVGGHQDAARDVMSRVAQFRHEFRSTSYDLYNAETGGWRQLVIADRKDPIPETAAFRIDFAQWLKKLSHRDRKVIAAFIRGERTMAVAEWLGISQVRVSQLRRKYENSWEQFQGEAATVAS